MDFVERDSSDEFDALPVGPTLADDTWLERALDCCSDPTYVLDAETFVTWVNSAGAALVGLTREEALGRSIAEFVHPDDLVRAAEVLGLAGSGVFDEVSITPALYRVRSGAGDWVSVGVNASLPQPDGSVLVTARVGGDLVILDQLLEDVIANAPFARQVETVLDLARWRHPSEGYAILYTDVDGSRRSITSDGLDPVLSGEEPTEGPAPWTAAVDAGQDVVVTALTATAPDDPAFDPRIVAAATRSGFTGCIAAPVPDLAGHVDACIVIWATANGPTHAGHGYALANMRRALALVLQQRAQRMQLERAARADALTGLWSRAGFFELVDDDTDGELADGFSVLYIDLDGFKDVNDSHGHTIGDHVLVTGAQRIAALAPAGSIAARLGGDEFVLVCPAKALTIGSQTLAQQIIDALSEPVPTPVGPVIIGASVGVASGRAGEPTQPVLEAADAALLAAKAGGRARWVADRS